MVMNLPNYQLVMITQQRRASSLISTPGMIVAESGVLGLFRGLLMSCGREGVFTAGMLGLGPAIKRHSSENWGTSPYASSIVGAIGGGVIVATISHPMVRLLSCLKNLSIILGVLYIFFTWRIQDTIKTCQQGDIKKEVYGGVIQTARTLLSQGNAGRFFSGWSFRTGRMVIQTFLFDECKTRISPILFPQHFN